MCILKTIAVVNQKGGVAKTTTTFNLAVALAAAGKNVLMVDLDPQASLTISAGINPEEVGHDNICKLFNRKYKTAEAAITVDSTEPLTKDRLYIIPSDINLATTEMEIFTKTSREKLLKKALAQISNIFDYCFIDCPPNLGMLTINALVTADDVIIPTKPEYLAYRGLGDLFDTIGTITEDEELNPYLKTRGIIVTLYQKSIPTQVAILETIKEKFPVLGVVRQGVDAYKSVTDGIPVIMSNPKSDIAIAYKMIADII